MLLISMQISLACNPDADETFQHLPQLLVINLSSVRATAWCDNALLLHAITDLLVILQHFLNKILQLLGLGTWMTVERKYHNNCAGRWSIFTWDVDIFWRLATFAPRAGQLADWDQSVYFKNFRKVTFLRALICLATAAQLVATQVTTSMFATSLATSITTGAAGMDNFWRP